MSSIFTAAFWLASAERAIKTFAQTLAATLVASGVATVAGIDWRLALGTAALASLLSVLTSIGSDLVTAAPGPSLTAAEQVVEDVDPTLVAGVDYDAPVDPAGDVPDHEQG